MKYTLRQTRFVAEYLISGNGRQAAIRAGYSVRSATVQASRLLTKANVSVAIEQKRAETARISDLRVADVVAGLIDAIEQAKVRADAKTQITAWREIAKILGFYPQTKKGKKSEAIDPSDFQTWPDELLENYDELT